MITYSTNWMGPISMNWYKDRGLLNERGEITIRFSAGRIDIRDDTKEGYAGWDEYSLPPMRGEDWNRFSRWLDDLETENLLSFDELIARYEQESGKEIRWLMEKNA